MDEKNLPPGNWLDDLEWDPLHDEAGVKDLFERVAVLERKRQEEAIRKANLN